MTGLTENIHLLAPEFGLAGLALLVFVIDLFLPQNRKDLLGYISVFGLIGLIVVSVLMVSGETESLYGGLLAIDAYSLFFKIVFFAMGIFIV